MLTGIEAAGPALGIITGIDDSGCTVVYSPRAVLFREQYYPMGKYYHHP